MESQEKLTVELPINLKKGLKIRAAMEGTTMKAIIETLLEEKLKEG